MSSHIFTVFVGIAMGPRDLGDESLLEVCARERGQEHVLIFHRRFAVAQLVEGGQEGHVRFAVGDEVGRLRRLLAITLVGEVVLLTSSLARALVVFFFGAEIGVFAATSCSALSLAAVRASKILADICSSSATLYVAIARRTGFWRASEALR